MKQFDWAVLFNRKYTRYTQLAFWVTAFFLYIILKEYPRDVKGAPLFCIVLQETMELAIPCYVQVYLVLPYLRKSFLT